MIKNVNTENLTAALVAASATEFLVALRFDVIEEGNKARIEMGKAGRMLYVLREVIMQEARTGKLAGVADIFPLYERARKMMSKAAKRFAACEKARKFIEDVPWPYLGDEMEIVPKVVKRIMK